MPVEELVTAAMASRTALAATIVVRRWSCFAVVQGVVSRAVFVSESDMNAHAMTTLAQGGHAGGDCARDLRVTRPCMS